MPDPVEELLDLARSILALELDPIDGARSMVVLRLPASVRDSDAFLAIRSIESEADQFFTAKARQHFAPEFREQIEARLSQFTKDVQADMLTACRDILAADLFRG